MSILRKLIDAGLRVSTDGQNRIAVRPASKVTDALRLLIRENKPELLTELEAAHRLAMELVAAIVSCCAARGDDAINRAGLIAESRELPPDQQADLRDHFREQATAWAKATGMEAEGSDHDEVQRMKDRHD
jgi:hypothetical protein